MRQYGFFLVLSLCWMCHAPGAAARALAAKVARVEIAGATLHQLEVRLDWPEGAPHGVLSVAVERADVELRAQPFIKVQWQCPLIRGNGWQCEGPLRTGVQEPLRLRMDVSDVMTQVQLSEDATRLHLRRAAATPDLTTIDLTQIPLLWGQQWLAAVWPGARAGAGTLDGEVRVMTGDTDRLQVESTLTVRNGALETDDGRIAAAGIGLQAELVATNTPETLRLEMSGAVQGGEVLVEDAYLALPQTPVQIELDAHHTGSAGWQLPHLAWRDGDALTARAELALDADSALERLCLHLRSADLSPWPERYLSGWLGLAGLRGLTLGGALDGEVELSGDGLERLDVRLDAVDIDDAHGQFALNGLDGQFEHAVSGQHGGELAWASGSIGGIAFGAARWPLNSGDGLLELAAPVEVDVLGGHVRLEPLRLRLPHAGQGVQLDFGLSLHQLELAPLSRALGWPAFRGQLTGTLPAARYADGWLSLDGGLSMAMFDGRIDVNSLLMERPFGVAPTVSADLTLMNLDLMAITEVFDFGSISGRLDGQIAGLRLLDWSPVAFDAKLRTVAGRGARQRISQRAVQDISSVGGGGLMHSLQGRALSLFKDFGYRRIGLGCRLLNEVCTMSGLHSAGAGFTIVEGAGLPRLDVVGFNREVDWPTLLERLSQLADGAAPVVQ